MEENLKRKVAFIRDNFVYIIVLSCFIFPVCWGICNFIFDARLGKCNDESARFQSQIESLNADLESETKKKEQYKIQVDQQVESSSSQFNFSDIYTPSN